MLNIQLQSVLILVVSLRTSQTFTCPQPSTWYRAAEYFCPRSADYHCLYNGLTEYYQQFCIIAERFPAGSYVLYEGSLNTKRCPPDQYQPKPYLTSLVNECIYQKSVCIGEGLVIHENGTTGSDRTCRCDYRRGYDFVTKPKNLCFCIPSEEDCSCYLKRCPDNKNRLTPDYECKGKDGLISCPVIQHKLYEETSTNKGHDKPGKTIHSDKKPIIIRSDIAHTAASVLLVAIVLLLALCFGFIVYCLRQSDKEITEAEIRRAQHNKTFVFPSFYTPLQSLVEKHSILMLKGNKGSGKTTLALHLAAVYLNRGYECVLFNSSNIDKFPRTNVYSGERYFIILDNIWTSSTKTETLRKCQKQVMKILESSVCVKFIFTASSSNNSILRNEKITEAAMLFDLDKTEVYSKDDKERILNSYLSKYKIEIVDGEAENKDEDCKQINSVTFSNITSVESLLGFPGTCVTFCTNTDHIRIGVEYFTNPPLSMVEDVCQLMKNGQNNIESAYQYCLLVYILLASENEIDLQHLDFRSFKDIYTSVFGYEIQIVQKFIDGAVESLLAAYLCVRENTKILFRHRGVCQAVLISVGKIQPEKVIQKCRLDNIMAVMRPYYYRPLDGEAVLVVDREKSEVFQILASRLLEELMKGASEAETVGEYLAKYIAASGDLNLIRDVEEKLGKHDRNDIKLCRIFFIFFSAFINLPEAFITQIAEVNDLSLCWMYICLKSKKNENLVNQIVTDVIERGMDMTFLSLTVDESRNTLLHYFIVWNSECEQKIISNMLEVLKKSKNSSPFQEKNSKGHTSLHFAAYLGRSEMFDVLMDLMKTKQSKTDKVISKMFSYDQMELVKITEQGFKQRRKMLERDDKIIAINNTFIATFVKFGNSGQFTEIINRYEKL